MFILDRMLQRFTAAISITALPLARAPGFDHGHACCSGQRTAATRHVGRDRAIGTRVHMDQLFIPPPVL